MDALRAAANCFILSSSPVISKKSLCNGLLLELAIRLEIFEPSRKNVTSVDSDGFTRSGVLVNDIG